MPTNADRIAAFRRLHERGCFVIPNPWDVGSARTLVRLGFKALATTSSGFAWTLGRSDNAVSLDELLAHLRAIAASVEVPVNADFEGGFAVEPEGVAANVARAVGTGIAGISIEDFDRRRRRAAVRSGARRGADPRGAGGHRRERHGRAAHRPVRGVHRRPSRPRGDDPAPGRLCGRRRRLPVCARPARRIRHLGASSARWLRGR